MKHKDIPEGYKDSPLGIIPKEWEVKRLGEICSHFKSGITITSKQISEKGKYPVYGGNGLRGYSDTYTHDGAYILIGRQGALCGNINYVEGNNYISEHAIAVQSFENTQWLKYKLDYWNLNKFSESSAQPGLSVEKLVRYRLSIPPIEEQRKIAEILDVWDKVIEKQTKLIDALIRRKRAIIKLLFNRKKRLCDFGEEWKEIKLGDCLKIGNGKDYKHLNAGDVPVLGTGGYMLSVNDYLYDGETVCIGRKGTIDKPMYHKGKIWTVDTLFYTHSYKNVTPLFIYYLFNLIDWQKYNEATGVPSLSKNTIEHIPVLIPTLTEQIAIVEILTNADNEIELAKQKLKNIQVQKKGIMQKLLTGKTRI